LENVPETLVPRTTTATMQITAISARSKAYSTSVAPPCDRRHRLVIDRAARNVSTELSFGFCKDP